MKVIKKVYIIHRPTYICIYTLIYEPASVELDELSKR